MATRSSKYGFRLPTNTDTPDLPGAMTNFSTDVEKKLGTMDTTLSTASNRAEDYNTNGLRWRGFIPVDTDVHTLDAGVWTLQAPWVAERNLTNMPTDSRANAPGNMEVLPFATGLKMLRWTTASFSTTNRPYTWVKFQSYNSWGAWKETGPDAPVSSVAGLTGSITASNLTKALGAALDSKIDAAVSQAAIEAAEGDLGVFDTRYIRQDNTSNQAGGPGTLANVVAPGGRNNAAYGVRALPNLKRGRYNNMFGLEAGFSLNGEGYPDSENRATRNDGFGANTQRFNTIGAWNVSMGRNTLQSNVDGKYNTVIGADAGGGMAHMRLNDSAIENQVPQSINANSVLGSGGLSRTQGHRHTALGAFSLNIHKNGDGNVGVGYGTMQYVGETGGYNAKKLVGLEGQAAYKGLSFSIADEVCTFTAPADHPFREGFMLEVEVPAYETQFWYVKSVSGNTVTLSVGMPGFTMNGNLTVLNYTTLEPAPITDMSIALGYQAGQLMENGSRCVAIRNAIAIGADAPFLGDNMVTLGNSRQTVHTYAAVQTRSDERDKKDVEPLDVGLDFVKALNPVSYRLNPRYGDAADERLHAGLIAQEVNAVAEGTSFEGVIETEETFSLAYTELVPVLIRAVQELASEVAELRKVA